MPKEKDVDSEDCSSDVSSSIICISSSVNGKGSIELSISVPISGAISFVILVSQVKFIILSAKISIVQLLLKILFAKWPIINFRPLVSVVTLGTPK